MIKWIREKLDKLFFGDMGIQIGPWDPLKLTFEVMSNLMKKGVIQYDDAVEILKGSLPDDMDPKDKDAIIGQMVVRVPPSKTEDTELKK